MSAIEAGQQIDELATDLIGKLYSAINSVAEEVGPVSKRKDTEDKG